MRPQDEVHPLRDICSQWLDKIQTGMDHKKKVFQETADECMKFFDGAHDFMYKNNAMKSGVGLQSLEGEIRTSFRMTVNKVSELVQLFGPYMYHRNPNRMVNPRSPKLPQLPMMLAGGNQQYAQQIQMQLAQTQQYNQARGDLLQFMLNYTPNELNLQRESRRAIDEALIKGRGCIWTEIYYPPDSPTPMIGSFYDSVDNLVTDPDADIAGEWKWISRRCTAPHWELEQEYGLEPDSLKSSATSQTSDMHAKVEAESGDEKQRVGETCDLVTYWKIYSKMGMGHYLRGVQDKFRDTLEHFGQYTYLVLVKGVPYPLNLSPRLMQMEIRSEQDAEYLMDQVRWPIPFHADNTWPMTQLDFHEIPGCSWPQAHMKPGLGELKAIDWVMSFLVSKVKTNSRDLLAICDELTDESKLTIMQGDDYDHIPIKRSNGQDIRQMVQFLQHPTMNTDILKVLEILLAMFERRVGLNELLYGMNSSAGMRSAAEASLKGDMVQIRINDMAGCVENWATQIARKEGVASRLFLTGTDVAPVFGEVHNPQMGQVGMMSQLWDQLVYVPTTVGDDAALQRVMREFDYRIEAGSVRKPNQQTAMENMDAASQIMVPNLIGIYQSSGDPTQLNAFMTDWAKARQFDVEPYLFPPMPPPGTPPPVSEMAG